MTEDSHEAVGRRRLFVLELLGALFCLGPVEAIGDAGAGPAAFRHPALPAVQVLAAAVVAADPPGRAALRPEGVSGGQRKGGSLTAPASGAAGALDDLGEPGDDTCPGASGRPPGGAAERAVGQTSAADGTGALERYAMDAVGPREDRWRSGARRRRPRSRWAGSGSCRCPAPRRCHRCPPIAGRGSAGRRPRRSGRRAGRTGWSSACPGAAQAGGSGRGGCPSAARSVRSARERRWGASSGGSSRVNSKPSTAIR